MLKPALLYKTQLTNCFVTASIDPRNKYYTDTYWSFKDGIQDSNLWSHQFVSIDKSDNVVGYLDVCVDRGGHYVYCLKAIKLLKQSKYNTLFAQDFKKFFMMLFCEFKYNKLNFSVVVGSPHEKMYDRFIKKYGGRIVGVKRDNWVLPDKTLCDQKLYEIFRKPLLKNAGLWREENEYE